MAAVECVGWMNTELKIMRSRVSANDPAKKAGHALRKAKAEAKQNVYGSQDHSKRPIVNADGPPSALKNVATWSAMARRLGRTLIARVARTMSPAP